MDEADYSLVRATADHDLQEQTHMRVDLQSRMLKAAFQLAKRSFEQARLRKRTWFQNLPQCFASLIYWWQGGETNLHDFRKACNLFHDWYPRLITEVHKNQEVWNECKLSVLQTMAELQETGEISQDDAFRAWMDQTLGGRGQLQMPGDVPRRGEEGVEVVRQHLQTMHAILCEGDATADSYVMILEFFRPILRIVWIIVTLDSLLVYEATFLGWLSQLIFEMVVIIELETDATADNTGNIPRLVKRFFLPLFVAMFAVVGAEMAELAHDGMQYPPFRRARASLIILTQRKKALTGELDRRKLKVVDMFLTWLLLVFMMVGVLVFYWVPTIQGDDGHMDLVLNGMNSGALAWTGCLVSVFAIARLHNNIFLEKWASSDHQAEETLPESQHREVAFRPSRCAKVLRDAIATYAIVPGDTHKNFTSLNRFLHMYQADDHSWKTRQILDWVDRNDDRNDESWKDLSTKMTSQDPTLRVSATKSGRYLGLASCCIWVFVIVSCWFVNAMQKDNESNKLLYLLVALNLGMILTLYFLSQAARVAWPLFADNKLFRVHIILFIVFMGLFSFATKEFFDETPNDFQPMMTTIVTNRTGVFYNDHRDSFVTPYPACNMWWGKPQAKVSLLDLGAMASYAYSDRENNFEENLKKTFGDGMATKEHFDVESAVPRVVAARLCRNSSSHGQCTVVMAVRGTSSKLEVMTDIGIFSTVAVLQVLDKVAPVLGTLPVSVLALILSYFRSGFLKGAQHEIIHNLQETKQQLEKKWPGDAFVATGHSLGGAFAELLGARLKIPAVGFSAPGQFYMMKTYKIDRESVSQNLVTIMPSLDPVPHVAKHMDMVQHIQCRDENGVHRKPWSCHSLENTMCELWRVCGDVDRRDFSQTCLVPHRVNPKCIGKDVSICDK